MLLKITIQQIKWFFLALMACMPTWAALAEKTNVIIVMTDDQGYGEMSCHGNPILQTPNLDLLHSQSIRFKQFHVTPMCTPTRGQLLTGLDAVRNGAINVSSGRALLRPEIPTMANYFGDAGYATGVFGKWHLGANFPFRPQDRGFQESVWFPSSSIPSVPSFWGNDYFDDTYIKNGQNKKYEGYCTDVFFAESMQFMQDAAAREKPFLCYLATNTPHGPLLPKKEDRKKIQEILRDRKFNHLSSKTKEKLGGYLGMILNIDENMGHLMRFLDEQGLAENTILMFLTDNGSILGPEYYNAGMRGMKTQIWEGGHRVPCFIRWPDGGFTAPRDVFGLTQVQDLLPTLLELCEIEPQDAPDFDGMSLARVMRGQEEVSEDRMLVINYSRMPSFSNYPSPSFQTKMRMNQAAVLWKDWRLLEDRELYNLASDPKQKKNVIEDHPEVVAVMRKTLQTWWQGVEDVANEPQRIVIGTPHENPTKLTACEWLDVFVDQQRQISAGVQKNGYWLLDVAEAGTYEIELRRWPREVDRPIAGNLPNDAGRALPIYQVCLFFSNHHHLSISEKKPYGFEGLVKKVSKDDTAATFKMQLNEGPTELHTWFRGDQEMVVGAYYVYVTKLD